MTVSDALVPSSAVGNTAALALLLGLQSAAPGLPHEREIVLLECEVKGTSYVDDIEDIEPDLHAGQRLVCVREPNNVADGLAIRLETAQRRKLGYVPRARNEVVARLMDAGKIVFARIQSKEWLGGWLRVSVEVVLHDL